MGTVSHTPSSPADHAAVVRYFQLAVLAWLVLPAVLPVTGSSHTAWSQESAGEPAPKLPAGFTPPPTIPPVMELENELLTEEEDTKIEKQLRRDRYSSILRAGRVDDRTRRVIELGARWRVHRMTMKSMRDELPKLRDETLRDVRTNLPEAPRDARELLLAELTKRATELLDGHNFYVRLNAIFLLGQLTLQDPELGKPNSRPVAWAGAAVPLLKVISDDKQPDSLKIPAASGLGTVLSLGQPNAALRDRITAGLVAALGNSGTHFWYQRQLARSLAYCNMLYPRVGEKKPFVVQALAKCLVDRERHWLVRCEAARSLGRVPLDAGVNDKLLTYEFVNLGHQMSAAYNKGPSAYYWKDAFFTLYLAFKPINQEEKAEFSSGNRLVQRLDAAPSVTDAYGQILPLVVHVLHQPKMNGAAKRYEPVPKARVDTMEKWLADNKQSGAVADGLEPITGQTVPAALPRTAAASSRD